MRDGVKLFTAVYVPKDCSTSYPIMLLRTPYSVAPYGVDNYRATIGPSEHFMKDGFIVVYQDVRGRYMSEGEWTEVRPHNPKKGPGDADEASDTWDTIDWLVKNVAGQQRQGRHVGHLVPGLLRERGHDRRPPGAGRRVTAGAGHRLLPGRRLVSQRRVPAGAQLRLLHELQAAPGRSGAAESGAALRLGNARRLRVLPAYGAAGELEHEVPERSQPVLGHQPRSSQLRRVLAGTIALEALQEHQAGGADRGRLVRRRGPAGSAQDVPDHRARQSRRQ